MLSNHNRLKTKKGFDSTPPIDLVLRWIGNAWASVPTEVIVNSFRACGFTCNSDMSNVAASMACFQPGGQLYEHVETFTTALNTIT
jgi:hypothetical protein